MPISLNMNNSDLNSPIKPSKKSIFAKSNSSISKNIDATKNINSQLGINITKKNKKKFPIGYILLIVLAILIGIGGFAYWRADKALSQMGLDLSPWETITYFISFLNKNNDKQEQSLATEISQEPPPELLRDSSGQYTNILLVGIDAREEDKSYQNTDTMIIASYNHDKNTIVMMSIPRDTFVQIPDWDSWCKINSVYMIGEQQEKGNGLPLLQRAIQDITGVETQYYMLVDIAGLKQIINIIGGVDVYVDTAFTDYRYPQAITGLEIETIHFDQGPQTLDAERAIQFARSRHSMDGLEGTDFARAKRQQKIIIGIKDKILSSETLLNPQKILEIVATLEENVKFSGYTVDDIEAGLNLADKLKDAKIYNFVLDPSIGNYSILVDGGAETGYTIFPVLGGGQWQDLRLFVSKALSTPDLYIENPNIAVYDTGIGYQPGYAKTLELINEFPFLSILYYGNPGYQMQGTSVFSTSGDSYGASRGYIADYFQTTNREEPSDYNGYLNGESITVFLGAPLPVEEVATDQEISDSQ